MENQNKSGETVMEKMETFDNGIALNIHGDAENGKISVSASFGRVFVYAQDMTRSQFKSVRSRVASYDPESPPDTDAHYTIRTVRDGRVVAAHQRLPNGSFEIYGAWTAKDQAEARQAEILYSAWWNALYNKNATPHGEGGKFGWAGKGSGLTRLTENEVRTADKSLNVLKHEALTGFQAGQFWAYVYTDGTGRFSKAAAAWRVANREYEPDQARDLYALLRK